MGEKGGPAQCGGVWVEVASVTLTLSFSPVPGDLKVNRSQNPSKCQCQEELCQGRGSV